MFIENSNDDSVQIRKIRQWIHSTPYSDAGQTREKFLKYINLPKYAMIISYCLGVIYYIITESEWPLWWGVFVSSFVKIIYGMILLDALRMIGIGTSRDLECARSSFFHQQCFYIIFCHIEFTFMGFMTIEAGLPSIILFLVKLLFDSSYILACAYTTIELKPYHVDQLINELNGGFGKQSDWYRTFSPDYVKRSEILM